MGKKMVEGEREEEGKGVKMKVFDDRWEEEGGKEDEESFVEKNIRIEKGFIWKEELEKEIKII